LQLFDKAPALVRRPQLALWRAILRRNFDVLRNPRDTHSNAPLPTLPCAT
jgi:hypothetical protein